MSQVVHDALFLALGALCANRVYPYHLPDNPTYPAIVYTEIASDQDNTLCGRSNFRRLRMQFDLYAKTTASLATLRDGLVNAMDSFAFFALLQNEFAGYEPEVLVQRKTLDYSIHVTET